MSRSWFDIAPLEPLIEAGYVLLTPNFRLARRIRAEWDARRAALGERVWEPLAVHPLESWLLQQWERALALGLVSPLTPISQGQALEVWQQAIADQESRPGPYHLLRPAGAAELCNQARDTLIRWQVALDDERTRQEFTFDSDCAAFLDWHRLFEQRLATARQCTVLDCIRRLSVCAAECAAECAERLDLPKVALVDFDDVPPLFLAVLTALCEEVVPLETGGEPGRHLAHAFDDKRTELQAVARRVADIHRADPEATVGVVLTDMAGDRAALEYLLRREFDCLGADYTSLPVNFSTGMSLDRTPVVRDALAVLALGQARTTVPAIVALLRSRFLYLPDANTSHCNYFVTRLFESGQKEIDVSDLRFAACQAMPSEQSVMGEDPGEDFIKGLVLGEHLMTMAAMRDLRQRALPSVWVQRFSAVLDCWGWPGAGPLDSLEYQQVELWYRTLEEFGGFDAVCTELDYPAALQLLTQCCSRQMSQPQTADSGVQVLGPLEAAGLRFDHLWLCGMQAGSWPAPARPNPFIPHILQRQRQMPHATAEREWSFAHGLLAQYSRSSGTLHASYIRQRDGIGELPSALLEDFSWEPETGLPGIDTHWSQHRQQQSLERVDDWQAPPISNDELARSGGGSGLLEDQSQCPFRAFARRRLAVEPLGTFGVGLSPADRGSIVHNALYALWGEISDHRRLIELQAGDRETAIERAVDVALAAVPDRRRRSLGRAFWALEGRHLGRLLGDWLQVEQMRTAFVVRQREQEVTLELGQLKINLRVDRIDELPDGSRVIIDYKTGTSSVQDWLGDRPARPQLLLYGIAEPAGVAALAFAQLRARDCRYVGLGELPVATGVQTDIGRVVKGRMDAADWSSLNLRWRENLARLAADYVAGDARVDPLSGSSCTWCGLQALCRIGLEQEGPV